MFRSWKLGSLFGIGIYVHATFLLLPAFVFLANVSTGQTGMAIYAVMMIPAVFSCVVLHELGHALTARRYGIETRDITLYPIGGVARLERLPDRPLEEFWIAVAGPAVNVGIAALLSAILWLASGWNLSFFVQNLTDTVLGHLVIINVVMLALFNMLPAFPMDGGRVLRALLATYLGQFRATTIAVQIGVAMAVFFAIAGIFTSPILTLIGIFVFFAGQQELAAVRYRHAHQSREPLDVLPAQEEVYDWPSSAPRRGFSGFTWDSGSGRWIEWRNGHPVHTISVN
ncbi:MAG TPA: site-2 protease family protein [Gemmataceae bacterium]|nr:site-2 protease family protein [Gemmataceae bacterium]